MEPPSSVGSVFLYTKSKSTAIFCASAFVVCTHTTFVVLLIIVAGMSPHVRIN